MGASVHVRDLPSGSWRRLWLRKSRVRTPSSTPPSTIRSKTSRKLRVPQRVANVNPVLLGFNTVDLGYRGFISSPLMSDIDEEFLAKMRAIGLSAATSFVSNQTGIPESKNTMNATMNQH